MIWRGTAYRDQRRATDLMIDPLAAFGLASVSAMLLFYWLEPRAAVYSLAFGIACWAAALYGWLAGVWPFSVVESIWGVVAIRRYLARR